MSYFTPEEQDKIRNGAYAAAANNTDLWGFFHEILYFAMAENGLVARVKDASDKSQRGDGAFRGEIYINEFAELLEIAIGEFEII